MPLSSKAKLQESLNSKLEHACQFIIKIVNRIQLMLQLLIAELPYTLVPGLTYLRAGLQLPI